MYDKEVSREAHVSHDTELKVDALPDIVCNGVPITLVCAFVGEFAQVVGFQFDAVGSLYAANFLNSALIAFARFKLLAQVLFGEFLLVAFHRAKLLRNVKHGHDSVVLELVGFNLGDNLLCIAQSFGYVGKNLGHLLWRLEPFLLCIVQSVSILLFFACTQAYQQVVRCSLLFAYKMDIVGGDNLGVGFSGQFQKAFVNHLLLLINRGVGAWNVCFMSLNFKIIVFSKNAFEPQNGLFGFLVIVGSQGLGNLSRQTCRGDDNALVVFFQQFAVNTGTVVVAVNPGAGDDFAQVVVARFVFG